MRSLNIFFLLLISSFASLAMKRTYDPNAIVKPNAGGRANEIIGGGTINPNNEAPKVDSFDAFKRALKDNIRPFYSIRNLEEIFRLSLEDFEKFLQDDIVAVDSEETMFYLLVEWLENNTILLTSKQDNFLQLVLHIRYNHICDGYKEIVYEYIDNLKIPREKIKVPPSNEREFLGYKSQHLMPYVVSKNDLINRLKIYDDIYSPTIIICYGYKFYIVISRRIENNLYLQAFLGIKKPGDLDGKLNIDISSFSFSDLENKYPFVRKNNIYYDCSKACGIDFISPDNFILPNEKINYNAINNGSHIFLTGDNGDKFGLLVEIEKITYR